MIEIFETPEVLAHAAAQRLTALIEQTLASQARFALGLSGGSTPRRLFELLADEPFVTRIPWEQIHVFWGDERCVPPDHADSNFRMTRETLLDRVPLPATNVYRIPAEREPAQAATDYEDTLRAFFGTEGLPRFDLLLQGMGDDGHTASLFPGTAALDEESRWVVANYVEKLQTWRVTLTAPVINAAANVWFLVAGASKTGALHAVLEGPRQPNVLPSQLIQPVDGALTWLLDAAAAAELGNR